MKGEVKRNGGVEASGDGPTREVLVGAAAGRQASCGESAEDRVIACVLEAFSIRERRMWVVIVDRPLALGANLADEEGVKWKVVGQQWHQKPGGPWAYALQGIEGSRPRGKLKAVTEPGGGERDENSGERTR